MAAIDDGFKRTNTIGRVDGRPSVTFPVTKLASANALQVSGDIRKVIGLLNETHAVRRYAVDLVTATRDNRDLRLGASPRATLHLLRAAKAAAAVDGREFVLPDDLQGLAVPVLAHRLLLSPEAQVARRTTGAVVTDVVASVPVPGVERQRRSG